MEEEHLVRFYADEDSSFDDRNSSDDHSSVEVTSSIDECENELVRLSTYLQLESDYENGDDQAIEWPEPPPSLISPDSSDIEELSDSHQVILSATSLHNDNIQEKCTKRKRRQWTIKEKLIAVTLFDKNQSGKRKQLGGGGKKLVYVDLDDQLFTWYREKVTFRHLEKEGRRISKELNHSLPSSSWDFRFMKRNGLSLQRPKRQDKVPLDEVHRLANSFYTFNRRASLWSIKRGSMGAFTDGDICNMDKSPLALFGDQAKTSVNDIGTSNEINGCISNKRFCTVILTVFHKNQRMEPAVLFKGKGNVGVAERQQYSKGIHVIFTPKAVINGPSMDLYCTKWLERPEIIQKLRKKNVAVSIIPNGCTQYLQLLDTSVFSVFKSHYQAAADEYIDLYSSCSKIKLAAKQQRILCTRLISTAWVRTQNSIVFERAFVDIGYTWIDESPVSIRTLQGFLFGPSTVTSSIIDVDDREDQEEYREKKKMVEENKKHSHLSSMKNN
ncbi:unnamed protein product, partial [Rotaria socialis]